MLITLVLSAKEVDKNYFINGSHVVYMSIYILCACLSKR